MRPQYLQTATKFAGGVLCYAIGPGIYDKFFKSEVMLSQDSGTKVNRVRDINDHGALLLKLTGSRGLLCITPLTGIL